jgi:HAMP domain-containing protein
MSEGASADLSETEQELEHVSDRLLADLDSLAELEQQKRDMDPADPERATVARRVEELALAILGSTGRQTKLVDVSHEIATGDASTPRSAFQVLTEWRAAERELSRLRSALREAAGDVERLRAEYLRTFAMQAGGAVADARPQTAPGDAGVDP